MRTLTFRHATRLTILLASLTLGLGFAQKVDLSGRAEATFGVAVDGTLPVATADLYLTLQGEVGSGYFPDAAYKATVVAGYDAATGDTRLELDEAYATVYLGQLELTAGKLRRFWGSTDGVNPVDVLNPRDLTFPPDSEKLAVPMLHGSVYADDVSVEFAVVPVFTPARLPGAAWRPAVTPQLPPGMTLVGVLPPEDNRPAAELGNVQFGARGTLDLGQFDVSATYFHGFRSQPTQSARIEPTGTPGQVRLQPVLDYDRMDLLGIDFSGTVGDVVLRGEAAYQITGDPDGTDPTVGNHSLQAVLGGEYLIPGGPRTVVQAIFDYTAPDAGQDPKTDYKAMVAMTYQPDARTQLDLGWIQSLDGSGLVMPGVSYSFADGVKGEAKAYVFYGGDGSEFGDWRDNSQLRVSLAYSF
ncbi:MAG: hypothetical protein WC972_00520 [Trueperaceae bacterium]|nr:hypothetical protein [Trueperaceae bacterium]